MSDCKFLKDAPLWCLTHQAGVLRANGSDCAEILRRDLTKAHGEVAKQAIEIRDLRACFNDQMKTSLDIEQERDDARAEVERLKADLSHWKDCHGTTADALEKSNLQVDEARKLIAAMLRDFGDDFFCQRDDSCLCVDHDARRFLAAHPVVLEMRVDARLTQSSTARAGIDVILNHMAALDPLDRVELFSNAKGLFCEGCGCGQAGRRCQCQNDQ